LFLALGYWAVFATLDQTGVLIGVLLGLIHALFARTALVNVIFPAAYPRVAAASTPQAACYHCLSHRIHVGPTTAGRELLVMIAAHVACGARACDERLR
jgi:hypothetical protein